MNLIPKRNHHPRSLKRRVVGLTLQETVHSVDLVARLENLVGNFPVSTPDVYVIPKRGHQVASVDKKVSWELLVEKAVVSSSK